MLFLDEPLFQKGKYLIINFEKKTRRRENYLVFNSHATKVKTKELERKQKPNSPCGRHRCQFVRRLAIQSRTKRSQQTFLFVLTLISRTTYFTTSIWYCILFIASVLSLASYISVIEVFVTVFVQGCSATMSVSATKQSA